jgi:hypothetical protein
MFVIIFDYLLVLTWYASGVLALTSLVERLYPPGRNWECSCCYPGPVNATKPPERAATAWMRNTFAPALYKGRYALPLVMTLAMIGAIVVVGTKFQEGNASQFPDDHPIVAFGNIIGTQFGSSDGFKYVSVVMYGLRDPPVTFPQSVNFFASTEPGYARGFGLRLSSSFAFPPSAQQAIVTHCNNLANNAALVDARESYCLLNDLRDHDPSAFPYADEAALHTALAAFFASETYTALSNTSSYSRYTGFLTRADGTGVAALWNAYNTTIPTTIDATDPSVVQPYYLQWESAVSAQCSDAAPCVMTTDSRLFTTYGTLLGVRRTAIQNMFLSVFVAYAVLVITTWNVLVPLFAVLSIANTILWSLAVVFLAGYKFNPNTAILSVMAVGLAVDYAVHITHFYNEAAGDRCGTPPTPRREPRTARGSPSCHRPLFSSPWTLALTYRYEKTQSALHGVGISVVGGAITTGGAAIPLMVAQNFVFFKLAGVFIFSIAGFGLLFTFFQLVPLLMAFGPTGETGDLKVIWEWCKSRCQNGENRVEPKDAKSAKTPTGQPDVVQLNGAI